MWFLLLVYVILVPGLVDCEIELRSRYDYVIVGGGTAGCVLATRLTEDPKVSVLLLEAGQESTDPFKMIPRTAMTHWMEPGANWVFTTEPQKHLLTSKRMVWFQAKELGGCSNHNLMIYVRGSRHDFDRWEELGNVGWNYSSVLPYFIKMEEMTDKPAGSWRGTDGPMKVRYSEKEELLDQFVKAGVETGSAEITDINYGDLEGYSTAQFNVDRTGRRSSVVEAYLRPVLHRQNLVVVTGAHVTKILIRKWSNAARGVVFTMDGAEHRVFAKREVIVSAGTMNSAKLLMLSGIGPKEHLSSLGIAVKKDLPVGQSLQDQIRIPFQLEIDESSPFKNRKIFNFETLFQYIYTGKGPWSVSRTAIQAFYRLDTQPQQDLFPYIWQIYDSVKFASSGPLPFPDLVARVRNGTVTIKQLQELKNAEGDETKIGVLTAHLHSRSRGTIRLKSTDPLDYPVIDYQYLEYQQDLDELVKAFRVTQELIKTEALQNVGIKAITTPIPECTEEEFDTDQYWKCYIRQNTNTFFHYTSSCKMDPGPTGVVDNGLRVKGVKKLRVVDASIMPLVTSGATHPPTVMIAEKAADMIKKDRETSS